MFIVRPKGILSTPKLLAKDLNWRTRFYPNPKRPDRRYSFMRDFFMVPVDPIHVRHATPDYTEAYNFFKENKYEQRKRLSGYGVPVPRTAGTRAEAYELAHDPGLRYVIRPLRHSGGRGYRVTDSATDFIPGQQYLSVLYPKRREYRIIFVYGKPTIWLRKKPNEGVENEKPWGVVNSFFQTINDIPNCRLAGTDCASMLSACPVVRGVHIVAADILYNKKEAQPYVVLELNACPALTIDENRGKIATLIKHHSF